MIGSLRRVRYVTPCQQRRAEKGTLLPMAAWSSRKWSSNLGALRRSIAAPSNVTGSEQSFANAFT